MKRINAFYDGFARIVPLAVLTCLTLVIFVFSSCSKDEPDEEKGCDPGLPVSGNLRFSSGDGQYQYRTSGGGLISIRLDNSILISHEEYAGFSLELWGIVGAVGGMGELSANHENLNGKHIKDRHGPTRTILFPDGAKITIVAAGEYERIRTVTIYEAGQMHRISSPCNTVVLSSTNAAEIKRLDDAEADGEAGSIEITPTGLIYWNNYTEPTPGNRTENKFKLGGLIKDQPNLINDFYDDPRLGHT
jgi:hypothetical protein